MRSPNLSKALIYRVVGAPACLCMILAACQPSAPINGPAVTPKSEEAACRFGPGTSFSSIATLPIGRKAKILGTNSDHTWWKIEVPTSAKTQCWVSDSEVIPSGDLSRVPVAPIPSGLVTALTISAPAVIHSSCDGDTTNPTSFKISMTTNGPATVTYHLEVYNPGGSMLLMHTEDISLAFVSASTQTFDTGDVINTDCGKFNIKAIVSIPNSRTAQTSWSVVSP
jgi:uncharacterized protein YraI